METIKVKRTGLAPLVFEGEKLGEVGGKWSAGRELTRWWDFTAYRATNSFVFEIRLRTCWQGETDEYIVKIYDTLAELAADCAHPLSGPAEHLFSEFAAGDRGYPLGDQFAEKRERIADSLRRLWRERMGELLEELGMEERLA